MLTSSATRESAIVRAGGDELARAVMAIGTEDFESTLLGYLRALADADHCSIVEMRQRDVRNIGAASSDGSDTASRQLGRYVEEKFWQRDVLIARAMECNLDTQRFVGRVVPRIAYDHQFWTEIYSQSQIRERLFICGQRSGTAYGISILRSESRGPFCERMISSISHHAELIVSLAAKHAEARNASTQTPIEELGSISEIERRLADCARLAAPLSRREIQVFARIVSGMSVDGIAIDLGISKETVATYRKRAYSRQHLSNRHELMLWYLKTGRANEKGAYLREPADGSSAEACPARQ